MFDELAKNLPNRQDKELLRTLLEALRKDGADGVTEKIQQITNELVGDN